MKKYEGNMKKFGENMKEIWKNRNAVGLGKFTSSPLHMSSEMWKNFRTLFYLWAVGLGKFPTLPLIVLEKDCHVGTLLLEFLLSIVPLNQPYVL
mgnify:CR=1 FL=1